MLRHLFFKKSDAEVSIRHQLLYMIITGVVVLGIVGSGLTAWLTSQQIKRVIANSAVEKLQILSDSVHLPVLNQDKLQVSQAIEHTLTQNSVIGAAIFNGERQLVAEQNIGTINFSDKMNDAEISEFEDEESLVFTMPLDYIHPGLEVSAYPAATGFAVIRVSKKNLTGARIDTFVTILSIGSAMTLFFLGLINVTISKFVQPINRLAELMTESKNTGMHLLSKEEGTTEIRQMARAYNSMIKSLDEQELKLRKHSEQLETQVEIRTDELVKARDAALTASRHKSVFLANVTHELRTPIQAIIGYIDLVKEELELEGLDHYSSDLNKVQRSSERLLTLINDILDLSKVEAGKMDVKMSVVEVKPLIANALDSITPILDIHQNLLVGPQNQTELFIETDKNMLQQIIINLLSNACKFTKQGTITIDYYSDETDFYVSVKDTGCGISADKLNDIFDEFRQVTQTKKVRDSVNTKQFDGTGLGLAISQKFASLLGGEISVESEVGVGSEFSLRLPL